MAEAIITQSHHAFTGNVVKGSPGTPGRQFVSYVGNIEISTIPQVAPI